MSIPIDDTRALLISALACVREIRRKYGLDGVQAAYNPPLPLDEDGNVDLTHAELECDFPPV